VVWEIEKHWNLQIVIITVVPIIKVLYTHTHTHTQPNVVEKLEKNGLPSAGSKASLAVVGRVVPSHERGFQ
jgi:hypothetical protein